MTRELRCFTAKNPWARLLADGVKLVENRGRNVHYRGPIGIHAGKGFDVAALTDDRVTGALLDEAGWTDRDAAEFADFGDYSMFQFGAVLAVAELVDCHLYNGCCGPWGDEMYGDGPAYHLVLADVRRLPEPVPARGSLALPWTAPEDVAAAVWGQL